MFEFVQLVREFDNIISAYLEGVEVDFFRLRNICVDFNNRCVVESVFNTNGTDQQLWESVNTYFRMLLKKS